MSKIIDRVKKELKQKIEPNYRDGVRRFFKEEVKNYGVRTPESRKIAAKFFQEIKGMPKDKIFELIEMLLKSGYSEEATIGFDWSAKMTNRYEKKDFEIFKSWVERYVDNWAKCDDFCTHSLGFLVNKYPALSKDLFLWTKSKNRWMKRASAVSYIYPVNKPKNIKWVMKTAQALLMDPDDMVQKGYGWMLKEASKNHLKIVFEYVMKEKHRMPRTALRYAIELMDQKLKKQAMKK